MSPQQTTVEPASVIQCWNYKCNGESENMVSEYEPEKKLGWPLWIPRNCREIDIVMLLKLLACYCRDWIVQLLTGLPDQPRPVFFFKTTT